MPTTKRIRKKAKSHKVSRASRSNMEEKCWKKRKSLDNIAWQLRRGYKAAKGERLRRKRREYEEYLDRFCE